MLLQLLLEQQEFVHAVIQPIGMHLLDRHAQQIVQGGAAIPCRLDQSSFISSSERPPSRISFSISTQVRNFGGTRPFGYFNCLGNDCGYSYLVWPFKKAHFQTLPSVL